MISEAQLRRLARELDVRLGYAEKNYVNSWILWAIYTSPYGDNLLFKGGTALSKLYFPETWRYWKTSISVSRERTTGMKQSCKAHWKTRPSPPVSTSR